MSEDFVMQMFSEVPVILVLIWRLTVADKQNKLKDEELRGYRKKEFLVEDI